jgi:hypothetical protein
VDWAASQIHDPVYRLRFLKAVDKLSVAKVSAERRKRRTILAGIALFAFTLTLVLAFFFFRANAHVSRPPAAVVRPRVNPSFPKSAVPGVWLVENVGNADVYSNGLRVDNEYAVANHHRSYVAVPNGSLDPTEGELRDQPAGIIFHSSESQQAPFEAGQNAKLKRIGKSLLDYVRGHRAYNFVIDRFGRVYRVVVEDDAADHAGYSIWSDERWTYINLNESFLGVSFEAKSEPKEGGAEITSAQVRSAAMLIEVLRARYHIPASNCVTHGQVSVNPSNMRVGYHTDWSVDFPFDQIGLPDNYAQPLTAIWRFGFSYDPGYGADSGSRIRLGVESAENIVRQKASASGESTEIYRRKLRQQYRRVVRALGS